MGYNTGKRIQSCETLFIFEDDLRDPDMTTVTMETGTGGTASAAILSNNLPSVSPTLSQNNNDVNNEKFPYPTLEPGFDLLSEDWFTQKNLTTTMLSDEVIF